MFKKVKSMMLIILLVGVLVGGCSSAKKSYDSMTGSMPGANHEMKEEMTQDTGVERELGIEEEVFPRNKHQKLIYRASMTIEVAEKVEPLIESMKTFVEDHNGYIENMEQYRNGYDPVSQEQLEGVFMRIRIPHEYYNQTLQTIGDLGTLVNKSSSVEDVTLAYSDIESTLKMYKVEQERLIEMLANKATDVKDMIEIETRLSQVRIELEKQESARRALESQINYDTIELEISQVRRTSDGNQSKSFGSRIKATFIKSVDRVIIFFQKTVLSLTYMLIPLIIVGVILAILYIPFSKIIKRQKNKSGLKDENNAD